MTAPGLDPAAAGAGMDRTGLDRGTHHPTPSRHARDCLLPAATPARAVGGLAGPGRQRVAALAARWRSLTP